MKTSSFIISTIVLLFFNNVTAQPGIDVPIERLPGKCYAKCIIPDEYEVVKDTILVEAASYHYQIVPAQYETITLRTEQEEHFKIIEIPAKLEIIQERYVVQPAHTNYKIIPATFDTIKQLVMVKPSWIEWPPYRPKFESYSDSILIQPSITFQETINPANYKTVITDSIIAPEKYLPFYKKPFFKTINEKIEISPGKTQWIKQQSTDNCLSEADDYNCYTWCLAETAAQYHTVQKQINIGCDQSGIPNSGCLDSILIPAKTKKISQSILVSPTEYQEKTIPAQYINVFKQKMIRHNYANERRIPGTYKEINVLKLKEPAKVVPVAIPAVYGTLQKKRYTKPQVEQIKIPVGCIETRTERVLVRPAYIDSIRSPAKYLVIKRKKRVKKGGFSAWKEVLCGSTDYAWTIREVQEALIKKGYKLGPVDNVLGDKTKAAIIKFQQDNKLPIGTLDRETLEKLGILSSGPSKVVDNSFDEIEYFYQ